MAEEYRVGARHAVLLQNATRARSGECRFNLNGVAAGVYLVKVGSIRGAPGVGKIIVKQGVDRLPQ